MKAKVQRFGLFKAASGLPLYRVSHRVFMFFFSLEEHLLMSLTASISVEEVAISVQKPAKYEAGCRHSILYCIVVGSRRLMPPDALQPKAYFTNPGL